ncbi:DUF6907 domain-containing protein [Streptomyces sp. NPDC001780]
MDQRTHAPSPSGERIAPSGHTFTFHNRNLDADAPLVLVKPGQTTRINHDDATAPQPDAAVARALADIATWREHATGAHAGILDLLAEQVRESGDPCAVFDQVLDLISQASLNDLLRAHGIRMAVADGNGADIVDEALLLPNVAGVERLLLVPPGQAAQATLEQTRALLGIPAPTACPGGRRWCEGRPADHSDPREQIHQGPDHFITVFDGERVLEFQLTQWDDDAPGLTVQGSGQADVLDLGQVDALITSEAAHLAALRAAREQLAGLLGETPGVAVLEERSEAAINRWVDANVDMFRARARVLAASGEKDVRARLMSELTEHVYGDLDAALNTVMADYPALAGTGAK